MSPRTPPLPALRAFAALVRLGSMGAAAEQLHLTPGAVGHQIRALEELLGVALVDRRGRQLTLTEAGRRYGYQVRQALQDLADATERVRTPARQTNDQVVRVAVLPSFAQGWLLPRLPRFAKRHPQVRLVFHGSMDYADLGAGQVDCAIRFGHGQWPDAVVRPLMPDRLLLVASPQLLGTKRLTTLAQLLRQPLLHSVESWASWLSSMDPPPANLQRPPARMEFTDSTHLLEAVRLGLGAALTRRSIADHLLSRGEVVQAFAHECLHTSSYHALVPKSAAPSYTVELFLGWLQDECRAYHKPMLSMASTAQAMRKITRPGPAGAGLGRLSPG